MGQDVLQEYRKYNEKPPTAQQLIAFYKSSGNPIRWSEARETLKGAPPAQPRTVNANVPKRKPRTVNAKPQPVYHPSRVESTPKPRKPSQRYTRKPQPKANISSSPAARGGAASTVTLSSDRQAIRAKAMTEGKANAKAMPRSNKLAAKAFRVFAAATEFKNYGYVPSAGFREDQIFDG